MFGLDGGDDQLDLNAGAFQPDSTFGVRKSYSTSSGRGYRVVTLVRLSGDEFAWLGQIDANPRTGAVLPGGGDELTQLGCIQRGDNFLVADTTTMVGSTRMTSPSSSADSTTSRPKTSTNRRGGQRRAHARHQ